MKRFYSLLLISTLAGNMGSSALAVDTASTTSFIQKSDGKDIKAEDVQSALTLVLDLKTSIQIAMENNLTLKSILQDLKRRGFDAERAEYNAKKIKDGEKKVKDGQSQISQNETLLNKGLSDIETVLSKIPSGDLDPATAAQKAALEAKKQELLTQQAYLNGMKKQLESGELSLSNGLEQANIGIAEKLGIDTSRIFDVNSTSDLMNAMAGVSYEVTGKGYEIAKKQIAMLVEKQYYDVIKANKLVQAKQKVLERAKGQHNIVKAAYKAGMKAKDDLLLAEAQVQLMTADLEKAKMEAKNAAIELKSTLNIPLTTEISIKSTILPEVKTMVVEEGLKQGLQRRLEIQKTEGQLLVERLNYEMTQRQYPEITFQYQEALLRKERAELDLRMAQHQVETDIRKSYETMMATQKMYENVQSSVKNAEENLKIATYRYSHGFGIEDSANLKSINAGELAGTIMEVLAAGEKLADIEEKVIQIEYARNLAVTKYLNDIGTY